MAVYIELAQNLAIYKFGAIKKSNLRNLPLTTTTT